MGTFCPCVRDCCGLRTGARGQQRGRRGPSSCRRAAAACVARAVPPGGRRVPAVTPRSLVRCLRARRPEHLQGSGPSSGCSVGGPRQEGCSLPGFVISCARLGGEGVGAGLGHRMWHPLSSSAEEARWVEMTQECQLCLSSPPSPRMMVGADSPGALRHGPLCPAAASPTSPYIPAGDAAKCFAALGCKWGGLFPSRWAWWVDKVHLCNSASSQPIDPLCSASS